MGQKEEKEKENPEDRKDKEHPEQIKKRLESKVRGLMAGSAEESKENAGQHAGESMQASKPKKAGAVSGKQAAGVGESGEEGRSGNGPEVKDAGKKAVTGKKPEAGKQPAKKAKADKAPLPEKKKTEEKKPEQPAASLEELMSQKEEIEALLASIEDAYREATLPDTTYQEVRTENEKKLSEITRQIEEASKAVIPESPEQKKAVPAGDMAPETPSSGKPAEIRAEILQRPAERAGELKAVSMIKELEDKLEDRLKGIIASASVEITDKRIRKVDERLDVIESEMKDLKKAADTVGGYDKQFNLMNAEVEKTKALVESSKEAKGVLEDKLQRITESFAEIRSIVYQREASSKEQEVLLDKLKDAISQVDTARILREFTVRDEQLKDVNTRLEKLERSNKMLSESTNKIRGLLTDVGSLENILKASKMVKEKLERIQEIEERMKANASKLEGVYVDMKKKLDEFSTYKVKQDKLDGMANDIFKNVEELTRRLSDFVTKDDLDATKKFIMSTKEEIMASAGGSKGTGPVPAAPEAAALKDEKEEIEALLSTLEENLKNKEISKEEYENAKSINVQRLKEIEEKIRSYSERPPSVGKPERETEENTGRHKKTMLLAKLRESYENGELSKAAYEKSKKMLLGR